MKVLAFFDQDGHMRAFDVSTPNQERGILTDILKERIEDGLVYEAERPDALAAISSGNIEALKSSIEESDSMGFARGQMGLVEVEGKWEKGLFG